MADKDDQPPRRQYFLHQPETGRGKDRAKPAPFNLPPEKPLDWPPGYVPRAARETIMERRGRGTNRTLEVMPGLSPSIFTDKSLPKAALSSDVAQKLFDRRRKLLKEQKERVKSTLPQKEPEYIPKKNIADVSGLDDVEVVLWSIAKQDKPGDVNGETDSGDDRGATRAGEASSTNSGRGDHIADAESADPDS